jgi:hypothetical protein
MDDRLRAIDVGAELPTATKRVDDKPASVAREDELTEMDVPVPPPRPTDVLARPHGLARFHERLDMAVAEVAYPRESTHTAGSCLMHAAAFDCIDAMRPTGWSAPFRPVIAHRHVNSLVVDGAAPTIGARVKE